MKSTKDMVLYLENIWDTKIAGTHFDERIKNFKNLSKKEQEALKKSFCEEISKNEDLNDGLCRLKICCVYLIEYFKMIIAMYKINAITKQDAINIIKTKKDDYIDGVLSLYFQKTYKDIIDEIKQLVD